MIGFFFVPVFFAEHPGYQLIYLPNFFCYSDQFRSDPMRFCQKIQGRFRRPGRSRTCLALSRLFCFDSEQVIAFWAACHQAGLGCKSAALHAFPNTLQDILRPGQRADQVHRVHKYLLHQQREVPQGGYQPQCPQDDGGDVAFGAGDDR